MAKRKSKAKNNSVRNIDLSGVQSGIRLPVGSYPMVLTEAEFTARDSGGENLELTFEVTEGKFKGNTPKAWIPFMETTLWRVRGFLEACQVDIPDSSFDLDVKELVEEAGALIGVVEQDDPKYKPKLQDFLPADGNELSDEGDEDEESESDDEDDITTDDIKEMDEDELEEVIEEFDLDVDLDDYKTLKKKIAAVVKAYEESQDDEDEESESDDDTYSEDDVNAMGTKELRELVKKHDLDVELEGSTKKKRKLVIEALEEEELLS